MSSRTSNIIREDTPAQEPRPLLPVPDQEDVEGFIILYQSKYGIVLEPAEAHDILGGLMRFLYLTRRAAGDAPSGDGGPDGAGRNGRPQLRVSPDPPPDPHVR